MSALIGVAFGLAGAVAFGAATAGQHTVVHTGTGVGDARGLLRSLTDPKWLAAAGGDVLGFVFQVIGIAAASVVLVQPMFVLALPISLMFGALLGGPKPVRSDYLQSLGIVAGLALFFVLIGQPAPGRLPDQTAIMVLVAAVAIGGVAMVLLVRRRSAPLRAAVYGTVAGTGFGVVGVLLDAASQIWRDGGLSAFGHRLGVTILVAAVAFGLGSIWVTQVSFQIGSLGASFPANLAADPIAAVLFGTLLLGERIRLEIFSLLGYLVCIAVIVFCAIPLADPDRHQAHSARNN